MSKSVREDCVRDESKLAPICIPICVNNTRRTSFLKLSHPTGKNEFVVFVFLVPAKLPSPHPHRLSIDECRHAKSVVLLVLKSNSNRIYKTPEDLLIHRQ